MSMKWERIADALRSEIQNGELTPGQQLQTEQALCARFDVSLPVVRRAVGKLVAEGLVETVHGKGSFVRRPRHRVRRTPERYQWEKDRVLLPESQRRRTGATERDTGLTMADLEFHANYEVIPANDDLAAVFEVPVGAKMLKRTFRTRSRLENAPLNINYSYLVYDVAAENPALLDASNEPWPGGTQHQLHTIGIEVDRIVDLITARPPTPPEEEELRLAPGTPVFVIRKTSYDLEGKAVEMSNIITGADRTEFCYTTKLKRWAA